MGTYQSDLQKLGVDELYKRLSESIKNSKGAYSVYLTAVLLVMTTIMTISPDAYLVKSELSLPIIGLKVRFFWFYLVSPIVLIAAFLYLHTTLKSTKIYLDVILYGLGERPVNASPWFVTNDYILRLYRNKRYDIRAIFVELSLWLSMPIVLGVFCLSSIKYHDPLIFWSSLPFVALSVVLSLQFRRRFKRPLNTQFPASKLVWSILAGIALSLCLVWLNDASVHGKRHTWMTFFYTNIVNENLEIEKGEGLNGIVIDDKNLNNCKMEGVVLQKARGFNTQFEGALLSNVNFQESKLAGASFAGATLEDCTFNGSDLYQVSFEGAELVRCTFDNCQIQRAVFSKATLLNCSFLNLSTQTQDVVRAMNGALEISPDTRFDAAEEALIRRSN